MEDTSHSDNPAAGRTDSDTVAPRWWRRLAFWRALTGMAAALALGAIIVAAEFSATLIHRTSRLNQRLGALNATVQRLRRDLATAQHARRVAFGIGRQAGASEIKRILDAPDVKQLKLVQPASINPPAVKNARVAATLSMSAQVGGAALHVEKMPAAPHATVYRAWWIDDGGKATSAGEFLPGADGVVNVLLAAPPSGAKSAMIVTVEDAGATVSAPSSTIALRSAQGR